LQTIQSTLAKKACVENSAWTVQSLVEMTDARNHLDGAKDERERFVPVLEIPPVVSAEEAVQVQITDDVKVKK
jgi:hypothetical protein